jgi:hypothetical protein
MIRWAETLYETANARWIDGDDGHDAFVKDCAQLVRRILEFDRDNKSAIRLMHKLHDRFGMDV